ncbi:MAG: tyrosine-type recombinase/integrase [Pseudonocardiaceae bacterium]
MSSVEKRTRDGKVTWLARWRDPEGRQRKQSFTKRVEAARHAAAMEADAARGVYVDGTDRTTVSQACWAWLERRSIRDRTRVRLSSLIKCHIDPVPLGSRRVVAVRPSEIHAWVADRGTVIGPASLRKLVGMLKSVMADAVLDRRIVSNPVVRVSLPSVARERVVPLSVAQVLALADAVVDRYRSMVLTQAGLGLRIGELLGLRVCDVDFLRRVVHVEHQSHEVTRVLVPLKTASSRRTVPLPAVVADALAAHLAAHPTGPDVGCACPAGVKCSRAASALLFHTAAGTAIDQDYYGRRVFGAAVRKVKAAIREANATLPKGAEKAPEIAAGTTSHDLRHHFASVLLQAGESVVAVAEWLGHDNAHLVLTTYGHLMANSEDRMRKAVDTAYSLVADSCAPTVPQRSAATS